MKKIFALITLSCFLVFVTTSMSSCSQKTGCPALENTTKSNLKKNGMPKKKATSGVMPRTYTNKQTKKRRIPKKRKS